MSVTRLLLLASPLLLLSPSGCKSPYAYYCNESVPCDHPEAPYCDLTGEYGGVGNHCIPSPFDAGTAHDDSGNMPDGGDTDACAVDNGGCGDPIYWTCANNEGSEPTCTPIDLCETANGGCGSRTYWTCTNNPGADPTCSPATPPSARHNHGIAYDGSRARVVLFGGWTGAADSQRNDHWEWDGRKWTERTPIITPPARIRFAMAYDSARSRVVVFGGVVRSGAQTYMANDTWEWNGTSWTEQATTGDAVRPPARRDHAMAYDSQRDRIVVFGGEGEAGDLDDTWEWDGATWIQRQPATRPPTRFGHAMSYDSARGRVVLFGGGRYGELTFEELNDTWEWNGTAWTEMSSTSAPPSPRSYHAMAYDTAHTRTVLFGGHPSGATETWEWNGTTWQEQQPDEPPTGRRFHAMAYDAARGVVVMFGGLGSGGTRYDTWEWDGTNWLD